WALDTPAANSIDPILPDGHPELIVHCGDPFIELRPGGNDRAQATVLLAGQLRRAVRLQPRGHVAVVGARLRPDRAAALFRGPQHDLTDRITDMETIDRALARRLLDDVVPRQSAADRLMAFDRVLTGCLRADAIDAAVAAACDLAIARRGLLRVRHLALAAELSPRQLERRFRARVGLPPKAWLRVVRFQEVLRAVGA